MKPIKIEPGSGTKMAGKWIQWSSASCPIKILFVGEKLFFTVDRDGIEGAWSIEEYGQQHWLEVDPPAPEKPNVVRIGGKLSKMGTYDPSQYVFWRTDLQPLPIVIEYDEPVEGCPNITTTKTLRGKMFVEVTEQGGGK